MTESWDGTNSNPPIHYNHDTKKLKRKIQILDFITSSMKLSCGTWHRIVSLHLLNVVPVL